MSKKNIRILSLGFFVSAIIIVLTSLFLPGNHSAEGQTGNVEELETEITYLEDKVAKLEVAQATKEVEQPKETEQPADEAKEADDKEEASDNTKDETDQNKDDKEPEETPVIKTTVTIGEGEPSSVAAQQLESEKIIKDRHEFDKFLEDKKYAPLVRPGSYEINSDMTYEEMAQKLMGR
ncbi:hypothetical protein [Marinilactibacillus psychrotolerans]|uniref:Endolytic transglycosylase MltG n=2 Tax=Marinilactibacillus psychrotolerans TaxID=191770 RepID=A0AAV3WSS0_9LACT|nr:hypothetical protein [Marinilactibacillus psychrotolerans]SDC24968.1 hypothetical protein SAMN04488013_103123 [Marinilactibacillus psychrotolerans]SJN42285.1 hypothetical protein FM115_09405 [Marinilactibacillus psychrotolerans 42ea]GEL66259.1 hypothetical protein MPS01_04140 [Marinilactibacillus psychrotolerans]GEQ32570.1 hypothetical protein B795N_04520 [Marinilactibacillus psychrotolerans]GEQ34997.1 hypothetical protein M132T_05050 [Marinilactibacillus psychrotolerans]